MSESTAATIDEADLVVTHEVVSHPSRRRQRVTGIAIVAIGLFTLLAFGLGANSGDAVFKLSNPGDSISIPLVRIAGGPGAIVCGALICVLGAWQFVRGFTRDAMRWVTVAVGVLFVLGFFLWAGTGSVGNIDVEGMLGGALIFAVPIILGTMSGVMCERSGVINIAIEGKMLIGAFAGALVGSLADNLGAGVLAAVLAGGLFGALLAVFAIEFLVNQVVLGVVINLLVLGLTGYLYQAFMADNGPRYNNIGGTASLTMQNHEIPGLRDIPIIGAVLFNTNWIVYGMYVIVIVISVALFRTRWGLRTRAVGEHPRAAATVGIRVRWTRYRNVILGGMIAGLGGAFFTLGSGIAFQQNAAGMTSGKGYIALAALIFGRWQPVRALGAALLFGFTLEMQPLFANNTPLNIPSFFWLSLPYLVTILAVAGLVGMVTAPAADGEPYTG
jgi:simple sugar transport system permease protein